MSLVIIETFKTKLQGSKELFEDVRLSVLSDGAYHLTHRYHPFLTLVDNNGSRYLLGNVKVQTLLGKLVCEIDNPLADLPVLSEISVPFNDLSNLEFLTKDNIFRIRATLGISTETAMPVTEDYICSTINPHVNFVGGGKSLKFAPFSVGGSSIYVDFGTDRHSNQEFAKVKSLRSTRHLTDIAITVEKLTGSFIKLPEGLTKWL